MKRLNVEATDSLGAKETALSLETVPESSCAVVVRLNGGHGFLSRISALGLCVGTSVRILRNSRHGPMLLLARGTRIALGRGAANKIFVAMTNESPLVD